MEDLAHARKTSPQVKGSDARTPASRLRKPQAARVAASPGTISSPLLTCDALPAERASVSDSTPRDLSRTYAMVPLDRGRLGRSGATIAE